MVTTLRRRCAAGYAALVGLLLAFLLLPASPAAASGAIWLPTQQATFSATNKSASSMATYRNHAFILWLGDPVANHSYYQVYYTTNASGAWKTRLLSGVGPGYGGAGDGPRALIAVDPAIKRLYAAWPVGAGLVLYTSDNEGTTWQGPTILVKTGASKIFPNIALAADKGKVAIAFDGNPHDFGIKPACSGGIADVLAVIYNGTAWSQPQDLTSCVSVQSNGFRTQRLAYDETTGRFSLVAQDDSGTYRLWYAQGSGTTWSTPALTPMIHLMDIATYNGDYRVAAAGGTTYVTYALSTKPGTGFSYVDVYLGTHRSGQDWAVQRITHDPLNCEKFDVALAALSARLALAYRWGGFCAKPEPPSGPHEEYIHVLTGLPGHFKEIVPFQPPIPSSCLRPVLSTDGNVFRVLQVCSNVGSNTKGVNLYYTPEFLDVVGPITHITAISAAGPGQIRVAWTAQDPTPGSGVAYAQVEMRMDGGAWQTVVAATQSSFIVYTHAQVGHTYTFRVRSRDKVNNWGAWVTATIHAT
ncbi:MAG TPA: fibronectin type III domain-containing protein [Chloroflexota bacterium]|nr:fibronectin type III domain-containing protein [Chloroflexota bacterium]